MSSVLHSYGRDETVYSVFFNFKPCQSPYCKKLSIQNENVDEDEKKSPYYYRQDRIFKLYYNGIGLIVSHYNKKFFENEKRKVILVGNYSEFREKIDFFSVQKMNEIVGFLVACGEHTIQGRFISSTASVLLSFEESKPSAFVSCNHFNDDCYNKILDILEPFKNRIDVYVSVFDRLKNKDLSAVDSLEFIKNSLK